MWVRARTIRLKLQVKPRSIFVRLHNESRGFGSPASTILRRYKGVGEFLEIFSGLQIAFDEAPSETNGVSISIMIPFRHSDTNRERSSFVALTLSRRKYYLSCFCVTVFPSLPASSKFVRHFGANLHQAERRDRAYVRTYWLLLAAKPRQ